MSNDNVSKKQFWIGTAITIATVIVGIVQTHSQLVQQKKENRLTQLSGINRDLSKSIGGLVSELDAQSGMYLGWRGCLARKPRELDVCYENRHSFNIGALASAWRGLKDMQAYARPFVRSDEEEVLLDSFTEIQEKYQEDIREHLPPETEKDADKLIDVVQATKAELSILRTDIVEAFSSRF